MNGQMDIFSIGKEPLKIKKKIRLIELFAGYGSQALSLKYLGVPFEHHRICEWAVPSIQAYKDLHFTNDNTDYSKDLSIEQVVDFLVEKGISELEATKFCIEKNLYSPHYEISGRDGCVLCFNAKPIERKIWFNDYPQAIDKVLNLQQLLKPCLVGRPNEFPLRDYKHFIDTDQIDMFGNYMIN